MFLFVVYALAIWYGALRWRRRWPGFVTVFLGMLGLLLLVDFHTWLNYQLGDRLNLAVVRGLLYPYTGLVAAVGLFIAVLPRAAPPGHCQRCCYDLSGLDLEEAPSCPECGRDRLWKDPRSQPRV